MDLKKGDEVIVPAMSHTATSHAVEYTGAKTVFVDIDYRTGNIDAAKNIKEDYKKNKSNNYCSYGGIIHRYRPSFKNM